MTDKNYEPKKSISEEKSESSIETTLVDFETFKKDKMSGINTELHSIGDRNFDAIEFVKDKFNLKHFMIGPVALYKDMTVCAYSRRTERFENIIEQFRSDIDNGKEIFLYDIIYKPSYVSFYGINSTTFVPFNLDIPVEHNGTWTVRYGVLDKNDSF